MIERNLETVLNLVKPEYKEELKKVLETLAAKWDSLSEDQHEDYYWGAGTIGFIYDDNIEEWKGLPEDLEEIAINPKNSDDLMDAIENYICPFDEETLSALVADDAFELDW